MMMMLMYEAIGSPLPANAKKNVSFLIIDNSMW